jgi:hypothetical protein
LRVAGIGDISLPFFHLALKIGHLCQPRSLPRKRAARKGLKSPLRKHRQAKAESKGRPLVVHRPHPRLRLISLRGLAITVSTAASHTRARRKREVK